MLSCERFNIQMWNQMGSFWGFFSFCEGDRKHGDKDKTTRPERDLNLLPLEQNVGVDAVACHRFET